MGLEGFELFPMLIEIRPNEIQSHSDIFFISRIVVPRVCPDQEQQTEAYSAG